MGGGGGAAIEGPDSMDKELLLKYGFRDSSTTGAAVVVEGLLSGVVSRTLLAVEDSAGGAGAGTGGGDETAVGSV